jgi:preprotein translocase subunit YajC
MSNPEPYVLVLKGDPALSSPSWQTGESLSSGSGLEPLEDEEQSGGANIFSSLLPFLVIGGIFWVLLIAPERKNRKKQEQMRGDLKKGDEVMTTGGMFGRITAVDEEKVTLQIADGVRVKYLRQAIQGRVGEDLEDGKATEPEQKA